MTGQTITAPPQVSLTSGATLTLGDRRAIALLAGTLGIYTACLLPVAGGQYGELFDTIHAFLVVGVFLTALIALAEVAQRKLVRNRMPLSPADLIWYAFAAILTGLTIPVYGIFKQLILPARGFPLDPYLAAIDRTLFFGHDPWTLAHSVIGVVPTALIDSLYTAWMALMFLFPALVVAFVRRPEMRARLILCWLAVWIVIGSAAAWLLASAGPIFYDSAVAPNASFHALNVDLMRIAAEVRRLGLQMGAPEFQPIVLAGLRDGHYHSAGGISAMPSVHVSMAALFAIAGFQVNRLTGRIMTVLAAIIWVGSVDLGWHYACDGIVGTAMVWALWRMSTRIVPWLQSDNADSPRSRDMTAAE